MFTGDETVVVRAAKAWDSPHSGTSMISKVKGKTKISLSVMALPGGQFSTGALFLDRFSRTFGHRSCRDQTSICCTRPYGFT
jgi:hypothetical protein